jgi:hypothetical protein
VAACTEEAKLNWILLVVLVHRVCWSRCLVNKLQVPHLLSPCLCPVHQNSPSICCLISQLALNGSRAGHSRKGGSQAAEHLVHLAVHISDRRRAGSARSATMCGSRSPFKPDGGADCLVCFDQPTIKIATSSPRC